MHIWLWEYAFLVMLGYGRDESAPTPGGVFATNFVGVRGYIAECFATNFVGVRHAFVECSQRVRFLYVTYSHYKSMVFDVQKYGF